jgi:hypothetical protein|tara:strand:+ start:680 stop:1120 length:441 start_codon:yes stop_codon:yes gene_type:complete
MIACPAASVVPHRPAKICIVANAPNSSNICPPIGKPCRMSVAADATSPLRCRGPRNASRFARGFRAKRSSDAKRIHRDAVVAHAAPSSPIAGITPPPKNGVNIEPKTPSLPKMRTSFIATFATLLSTIAYTSGAKRFVPESDNRNV